MREQDLVHRAERAATALEGAWMRWRERHGLGAGPLPPVTSYVGYSVEEPWGQPRVVFGIAAAEAERIAAILELDAFAGPAGADFRAYPDRQRAESGPEPWTIPAASPGDPANGQPDREPARSPEPGPLARAVPAARQAPPPATAGRPPAPAVQDRPARPKAKASPAPAARPGRKAPAAGKDRKAEPPAGRYQQAQPAGPAEFTVQGEPLEPLPDDGVEDLAAGQPSLPDALSEAAAVVDLPADLPDNEAAYLQELAARPVAGPGMAAQRPHPAGPSETAEAPAPAASPRRAAEPAAASDEPRNAAERGVARLVQVSRRTRSRKQAEAAQWNEAGGRKRASSDTAV